jgi:hypothetical protein
MIAEMDVSKRNLLLGAIAFVAANSLLWWLSATVDPDLRPAFVGAAGGFSASVIGLGGVIIGAWQGHVLSERSSVYEELRTKFAELVALALTYRQARVLADNAYDRLTRGSPEDVEVLATELNRARGYERAVLDAFYRAYATVDLIASKEVREQASTVRVGMFSEGESPEDFEGKIAALGSVAREALESS